MKNSLAQLEPQKLLSAALNYGQVIESVASLVKRFSSESQEKTQDFQINQPGAYSCIYEGSQQIETAKRKAFITRQECNKAAQLFLEKEEFKLLFDIDKLLVAQFQPALDCHVFSLEEANKYRRNWSGWASKGEDMCLMIDELYLLILEYYKSQFIQAGVKTDFQVHISDIQDFLVREILKQVKKKRSAEYKLVKQCLDQAMKVMLESCQIEDICEIIRSKTQSLNDIERLISYFFAEQPKVMMDILQDQLGFKVAQVLLTKTNNKLKAKFMFQIKDSLEAYYFDNLSSLGFIEMHVHQQFCLFLKHQRHQEGLLIPEISRWLQVIIYCIQWTELEVFEVIKLLLKLGELSSANQSIQRMDLWPQADHKLQQFYQIQFEYLGQGCKAQQFWNSSIGSEVNITVIFQLFTILAGIEFVNGRFSIQPYSPLNRNILCKIIRRLNNGNDVYVNMDIVKTCEAVVGQLTRQLLDSIKFQNIGEEQRLKIKLNHEVILIDLQSDSQSQREAKQKFFAENEFLFLLNNKPEGAKKLELLNQQQAPYLQPNLKDIHSKHLKDLEVPNYFFFETISRPEKFSNVITLCISGFISEDEDKFNQWGGLMRDSTIVALHWKCSSIGEFLSFFAKNLLTGIVTKAYSSTIGVLTTLLQVYSDNPFIRVDKEAASTGRYLAYLICEKRIFGNCQINLVGHSLGTHVISECIKIMDKVYEQEKQLFVNSVMFLGGVADVNKLCKRRWHSVAGNIYNIYSKNDQVIKYILQVVKIFQKPCGEQKVFLGYRNVINCDFTHFIDGHSYYKTQLRQILKQTDFENDFKYIYERIQSG